MRISRWTTPVLALAPAAVLAAGLVAPAQAATTAATAAASNGSVSGYSPLTADARAAAAAVGARAGDDSAALSAYWTPARMRAAIPVEQAPFYQQAVAKAKAASPAAAEAKGAAGSVAPAKPAKASPLAALDAQSSAAGVPAAVAPNLPATHPTARTNGKVFFTQNGLNYVCSGSVINSEGKDSVWTAGHCVHGGAGGTWHSNWQFVPAYSNGSAPWGVWTSRQLWTKSSWISSSDFTSDMGVSIMNTRGGWNIVNYLGGNGITWNGPKTRGIIAFGYPAEYPYNGSVLRYCIGTMTQRSFFTPEDMKLPCDMTRGESGGAWMANYDGFYGYLDGVVSRIDRIVGPQWSYASYFDSSASGLYGSTRYL